jgi:hypothetical protein
MAGDEGEDGEEGEFGEGGEFLRGQVNEAEEGIGEEGKDDG